MDSIEKISNFIENDKTQQVCGFVTNSKMGIIKAKKPSSSISAGTFQNEIDKYLQNNPKAYVDYIHGIETTFELGKKKGNIGIFLPSIEKESFFDTVIKDGAFPRKTFSMGEAFEKRFYIETRKIV